MKIKEYVLMAFRDLNRRKGRTILTSIGITIGTLLIVTMVGLGMGLKSFMLDMLNSEGDVKKVTVNHYKYITEEDQEAINIESFEDDYFKKIDNSLIEELKDTNKIESLKAFINFNVTSMEINGKSYIGEAKMIGYNINEDIFPKTYINSIREKEEKKDLNPINIGRNIEDIKGEALIGEKLVEGLQLNPEEILNKDLTIVLNSPTGQVKKNLKIVGIINGRFDEGSKIISSVEEVAELTGFTKIEKDYFQNKGYDGLEIIVKEIIDVEEFSDKVKELGYLYSSTAETAKEVEANFNGISIGLTVLGAIVLLVAAIGIVNTMTMAIYERTRSIGVMKSVGADTNDIRSIFLVQSSIIGLVGGALGILLALGINTLIENGINAKIASEGLSKTITVGLPWYIVVGVLIFAIVIALLSGLYPANRAAKMDPIDALKG